MIEKSLRRATKHFFGTTLTGVDEYTSINDVQALMRRPGVELAFLYSLDSEGPRFVSERWMRSTFAQLADHKPRLALHVCGKKARNLVIGGPLSSFIHCFSRVQVNGDLQADELPPLHDRVPHLITQHTSVNTVLASSPIQRHSILVDGSGGTGLLPPLWERPSTEKKVGFAGGLCLANLMAQYQRIAVVAKGGWWIDLESGLRTSQDIFDPNTAWKILDLVEKLQSTEMAR